MLSGSYEFLHLDKTQAIQRVASIHPYILWGSKTPSLVCSGRSPKRPRRPRTILRNGFL